MTIKGLPDFIKIKTQVSFEDILKRYNLLPKLKSKGDQLTGSCPIHQGDGKKSFSVNLAKNCFNCFSCKAHGNVLDFVSTIEKVGVKDAGLLLSDWFNIPLRTNVSRKENAQSKEDLNRPEKQKKTLVRERKEDNASQRLEKAINPPLTFELKKLDQEHPYLKNRGLLPGTVKAFGLGYCSKGLMKGRIVVPIHNERKELVAYAGRWPGDPPEDQGKYTLPPRFQKSQVLFNLPRAADLIQEQGLILVEGYFSVFKLTQAGFPCTAALMGSSMSERQEKLIVEAVGTCGKLVLLLDNDEAGIACQENVLSRLAKRCFVKVVFLPPGINQPDEMTKEEIRDLFK